MGLRMQRRSEKLFLRCREVLAIDLEDIDWTERCIRIQGKGDQPREMFFPRRLAGYLVSKDGASRPMARSSSPADGHATRGAPT